MNKDNLHNLRVAYIGARIVGYQCLHKLLANGVNVVGVLWLDEKLAENTTAYTSFEPLLKKYNIFNRTFTQLREAEIVEWIKQLNPDLGIIIGVSQLLGKEAISVPRLGFLGMHPTLLPEGRGRAPIPWAIIKGLTRTGVSIFYLDEKTDNGDIILQAEVPIYYEDTSSILGVRTDECAASLLLKSVNLINQGKAPRISQDESKAIYWPRRRPEDGIIDWRRDKKFLYDWVRALTHPYPGAFTFLNGSKVFIWSAIEVSNGIQSGEPGEIAAIDDTGVIVLTGQGVLLLKSMQTEGQPELPAGRWAQANNLKVKQRFIYREN